MLWNAFVLALRAIRRNLMRSALTTLGIVIGVAAVIIMVTIGGGATVQVTEQIASLGTNRSPFGTWRRYAARSARWQPWRPLRRRV
jgi:ABC-type lipoprotein release transport system permease subunit